MKKLILTFILASLVYTGFAQCRAVADFTMNKPNGCSVPYTVFFTDQSTQPDTWKWEFGDGSSSTVKNPIHSYTSTGTFTVKLTVVDTIYGCTSSSTKLVSVYTPIANFSTTPKTGCGPLTINFTNSSIQDQSWLWEFGDGTTSDEENPRHTYEKSGNYTVSLTITAPNGCSKTISKNDLISVTPSYNIKKTVTICSGKNVTFPDGTTKKNITAQMNHLSNLTSIDGCDSVITTTVKVNPVYSENKIDSVCYGGSYTFPDGTTENDVIAEITHTSNLKSVKKCDSIINTTVKVITIDNSTTVSGLTITATMEEAEYKWINCNDNNTVIDTEIDSSYTAPTSGDYAVEITYKNCVDTSACESIIGLGFIENEFGNQLSVFPNPSTGQISVQLKNGSTIKNISLYNLTGQKLEAKKQLSGDRATLEITEPSGYYLLEITSMENKRARIKILKN